METLRNNCQYFILANHAALRELTFFERVALGHNKGDVKPFRFYANHLHVPPPPHFTREYILFIFHCVKFEKLRLFNIEMRY